MESINDYLRLQDEQLALTISAQRVEGYEVEGINEEIDKVKYEFFCLFCSQQNIWYSMYSICSIV